MQTDNKLIVPDQACKVLDVILDLNFAGIVLFTFLHFNETPAIVTSVVIGLGIVFCGGAVIHNVFVWQRVRRQLKHRNNGKC